MEASLYAGIATALASCGIAATTYAENPMTLDDEKKRAAVIASFQPDAILLMRQDFSIVAGIASGGAEYAIRLFVPHTGHTLWTATARFDPAAGNDSNRDLGRKFGADIIGSMAADGALRTCPSLPLPAN